MVRMRVCLLPLSLLLLIGPPGCITPDGWRSESIGVRSPVCEYYLRGGRVAFVLVTDRCQGLQSNGTPGGGFAGTIHAPDGRAVPWQASFPGKGPGQVVIDGGPYDLARGVVLLVSVHGGTTKVHQVAVDPDGLMPALARPPKSYAKGTHILIDGEDVAELGKKDPAIALFIQTAGAAP